MTSSITVTGLDELRSRFAQWPQKFRAGMRTAMKAALYVVWENVPPYPERESDYIRTGTLGRALGVSESGGKSGQPDIFEIKEQGEYTAGEFGTNLEYAPYVIGDEEQAWHHRPFWWTMSTVAEKAEDKVIEVFDKLAERLAAWLDRNASV